MGTGSPRAVRSSADRLVWYAPARPPRHGTGRAWVLDPLKEDALFVDGINGSQTSDVGKRIARQRNKIRQLPRLKRAYLILDPAHGRCVLRYTKDGLHVGRSKLHELLQLKTEKTMHRVGPHS